MQKVIRRYRRCAHNKRRLSRPKRVSDGTSLWGFSQRHRVGPLGEPSVRLLWANSARGPEGSEEPLRQAGVTSVPP